MRYRQESEQQYEFQEFICHTGIRKTPKQNAESVKKFFLSLAVDAWSILRRHLHSSTITISRFAN